MLYLISQLPDNQIQKLKSDINTLFKQKKTDEDKESLSIDKDMQNLLNKRKEFSQNNPESRLTWNGVREEIFAVIHSSRNPQISEKRITKRL